MRNWYGRKSDEAHRREQGEADSDYMIEARAPGGSPQCEVAARRCEGLAYMVWVSNVTGKGI